MTNALQEWEDHYRPLLGRRLHTFCFMPLAGADTADVVEGLNASPIWFTGAVEVVFTDAKPVFLTWEPAEDGYCLSPSHSLDERWLPYSLDSIRKSSEGAWDGLADAVLESVQLHTMSDLPDSAVVAAEHRLATAEGRRILWISTAAGKTLDDGDDLCVGMDDQPPGAAPLVPVGIVQ